MGALRRCCLFLLLACLSLAPSAASARPLGDTADEALAAVIPMPAAPGGGWRRGQMAVTAISDGVPAPRIDGRLDDLCWRAATHAVGFYRYNGSAPIPQQTEAWICCDRKYLYLAFHCLDSEPGRIRASETQRDGDIWHDDFVGVDIDSQNSRRSLSSFCVTACGTQNGHVEGGTADNITWAGDWRAAAARTRDGWTAEMAIPFRLLRYRKGTRSFGMLLYRQVARETSMECWPYLPPGGDQEEPRYLMDFGGLDLPTFAPRPVFLPYLLASGGQGSTVREGLDIKYPLTTTLTGLATVNPDFQTIEQAVTDIAFSYTEKFLPDRRPFFAEGSGFLPWRDIFYSRRIEQIDGGLKVVGKQGDTTIGLLATGRHDTGQTGQDAYVMNLRRDLGLFSSFAVNLADDQRPGQPANLVAKLEGIYGVRVGKNRSLIAQVDHIPSWVGGRTAGAKDYASLNWNPPLGHLYGGVSFTGVAPDFTADLGFNPDVDERGGSAHLGQYNHFDHGGLIEWYDTGINAGTYQHWHGGFFQRDFSEYLDIGLRTGWEGNVSHTESARDLFRDHTTGYSIGWGEKTLFQQGGASGEAGTVSGGRYQYLQAHQGFLLLRAFSLNAQASTVQVGAYHAAQQIVTGTYRLNSTQTIGGRLVQQTGRDPTADGASQPPQGTNLYLSFGKHVRTGYDLFVLVGDPNSPRTRGLLTAKVLWPL